MLEELELDEPLLELLLELVSLDELILLDSDGTGGFGSLELLLALELLDSDGTGGFGSLELLLSLDSLLDELLFELVSLDELILLDSDGTGGFGSLEALLPLVLLDFDDVLLLLELIDEDELVVLELDNELELLEHSPS